MLAATLDADFLRILKFHYSALVIGLETRSLTKPIRDGLSEAARSKQCVTISELVARSFDRHDCIVKTSWRQLVC
jgi:hypothetical protein